MVYGSISQGFRIGGGNLANVTPLPPEDRTYQPDSLWSYEVGAKTAWFDRHLIVNSSLYYINWSNIQVSDFTDDTNALTFIANAGKARVYGAEFEVEARITRDMTVGGTLALVEAQLTQDQPSIKPTVRGPFRRPVPECAAGFGQPVCAIQSSADGAARQFRPRRLLVHRTPGHAVQPFEPHLQRSACL